MNCLHIGCRSVNSDEHDHSSSPADAALMPIAALPKPPAPVSHQNSRRRSFFAPAARIWHRAHQHQATEIARIPPERRRGVPTDDDGLSSRTQTRTQTRTLSLHRPFPGPFPRSPRGPQLGSANVTPFDCRPGSASDRSSLPRGPVRRARTTSGRPWQNSLSDVAIRYAYAVSGPAEFDRRQPARHHGATLSSKVYRCQRCRIIGAADSTSTLRKSSAVSAIPLAAKSVTLSARGSAYIGCANTNILVCMS
ncbi:hypothetical protein OH77DRAFT_63286 [Trametes cingulata]|nr:hypothetical protein OH77DRAFT_63286 [Trametes cingulata]